MVKKKTIISAALSLAAATTFGFNYFADAKGPSKTVSHPQGKAKNVIVFIGDGMGAAHREAIRLATVGQTGKLAMDDRMICLIQESFIRAQLLP